MSRVIFGGIAGGLLVAAVLCLTHGAHIVTGIGFALCSLASTALGALWSRP